MNITCFLPIFLLTAHYTKNTGILNDMRECRCINSSIDLKIVDIEIARKCDSLISKYLNITYQNYVKRKFSVEFSDFYSATSFESKGNSYLKFYYLLSTRVDSETHNIGSSSTLSYIEIGKAPQNIHLKHATNIDANLMIAIGKTSSGAYIGMSMDSFLNAYNKIVFTRVKRFRTFQTFEFSCNPNDAITITDTIQNKDIRNHRSGRNPINNFYRVRESKNSCNYISRYIFSNDTLIKIGFGYMSEHPSQEFENILY